ncbi:MAG: hypothetical protein J6W82_05100 [Bacteroidales bacterium]|nr:hypothetical protein [Bacteroidales bacterium]
MATKKTKYRNGKVKVTIPRARKGEPEDFYVGVNGVGYQIPKGKEVEVPEEVAEEIFRAQAAEDAMYDDKEKRIAAAKV